MAAEYETVHAIHEVAAFASENQGRWPDSPEDLGGRYPPGGKVHIDYSITSAAILADPGLLRNAIRPKSGKFYTYPHYSEALANLLEALRSSRAPFPSGPATSD